MERTEPSEQFSRDIGPKIGYDQQTLTNGSASAAGARGTVGTRDDATMKPRLFANLMEWLSGRPDNGRTNVATRADVSSAHDDELVDRPSKTVKDVLESLCSDGALSAEALDRATRISQQSSIALPFVLTRVGMLSEETLAAAFARSLNLPRVSSDELECGASRPNDLNVDFLSAHRVLPFSCRDGVVNLAMADPTNDHAAAGVEFAYGLPVKRFVALESHIDDLLSRELRVESSPAEGIPLDTGEVSDDVALLADHASDAPVIRLVTRVIAKAVDANASDIHFEPTSDSLTIRYRIDGRLCSSESLSKRWCAPVASRLKLLAKLDIADRRLPQDGRIRTSVRGSSLDMRLATFPTLHGESVVLRLLGQHRVDLDLAKVGLSDSGYAAMQRALQRPNGLLLITGPTGSGKTTTLYAALNAIRSPERKLVSVEDPIEYTVDGISQLQISSDIGLTYAAALRSVLRNDPDIIMVGEIRDRETADIAVRAALTGHLVLATLHTNTAAGAITRLLDLGIDDYLLASTLLLTGAQRLVRQVCPACAEERPATQREIERLHSAADSPCASGVLLAIPRGCEKCHGRGYLGRTPIFEAITITESLRRLIRRGFDEAAFQQEAMKIGVRSMTHHGMEKIMSGQTTFDELDSAIAA